MYQKKLNFNKNKLINEVLGEYYNTFAVTLDTGDYVEEKFNKKIHKYIFKNLKKQFKKIDKEDKKYQKDYRKKLKSSLPKKKGLFARLFGKKTEETVVEMEELEDTEQIEQETLNEEESSIPEETT